MSTTPGTHTLHRVPPNCVFEVDDITKPWMWKEPFDYIHSANIAQGIRDWPEYLKRMYEYVRTPIFDYHPLLISELVILRQAA